MWIHKKKTNRVRKSEICSPTRFARLNRREPQIRDLLSASGLRPSLESALRAPRIGFASPHSRNPAMQSCSSLHRERVGDEVDDLSGANPIAAPAASKISEFVSSVP